MNAHISDAYTNLPNPYYIDPNFITDDFENPITAEGLKQISDKNKKFIEHTIKEKGLDYLKAFLSDENNNPKLCVNKMKQAYMADKDLYAMIAQSAFNNRYEDNLEFWPEFEKIVVDGHEIVCGSGREFQVETDELNSLIVPACYLVLTDRGEISANEVTLQDKIESDQGFLEIKTIEQAPDTIINGKSVANLRFVFN